MAQCVASSQSRGTLRTMAQLALTALAIAMLSACGMAGAGCGPDPEWENLGPRERLNSVRQAAGEAMGAHDHTGRIIYSHGSPLILEIHANDREITEEDLDEFRKDLQCALPIDGVDVQISIVGLPAIEGTAGRSS